MEMKLSTVDDPAVEFDAKAETEVHRLRTEVLRLLRSEAGNSGLYAPDIGGYCYFMIPGQETLWGYDGPIEELTEGAASKHRADSSRSAVVAGIAAWLSEPEIRTMTGAQKQELELWVAQWEEWEACQSWPFHVDEHELHEGVQLGSGS